MHNHYTINQRLRAARRAAGYKSARLFSKAFGIPQTTYLQHETGITKLSTENAIKYANLLRVNIAWLLMGEGPVVRLDEPHENQEKFYSALSNFLRFNQHEQKFIFKSTIRYQVLDTVIFTEILTKALDLTLQKKITMEGAELVQFCTHVYNDIIASFTDIATQRKMINLSMSSIEKWTSQKPEKT